MCTTERTYKNEKQRKIQKGTWIWTLAIVVAVLLAYPLTYVASW